MDIKIKEGRFLVKYARKEIEAHFGGKKPEIPQDMANLMSEEAGVFVKLNICPNNVLRGYAGYSEGIMPLSNALSEVSLFAAIRDHRFKPLRKSELKTTIVEVSILSKPELIEVNDPEEYAKKIVIGRDGVIVEKESIKGVLLPQMAVEFKWNPRQLLSHAAMTAGLKPGVWRDPDAKVYRFTAQIFVEKTPYGQIVKRKLR